MRLGSDEAGGRVISRVFSRGMPSELAGSALCARGLGPLGQPTLPKFFSVLSVSSVVNNLFPLPAEDFGEDKRRDNRRIGLDHILRGVFAKLAPCDFLVGNCTGITSVTRCGIADLAEISPERHIRAAEILV